MNVVVASMFRDSGAYLDRYWTQLNRLAHALFTRGDRLRWVAIENDSTDETPFMLDEMTHNFVDAVMVRVHDDCPYWPSLDIQQRWQHIAWVCNHALDEVTDGDDALLYVESDLAWGVESMLTLLDDLATYDAVTAPNFHAERGGRYYDVWGSRGLDGTRFSGQAPYHPSLEGGGIVELSSCASVLAVRADIARKTRFAPEDAFVGWCRDIRAQGWRIWMDLDAWVLHP